jgi:hypothetical protein
VEAGLQVGDPLEKALADFGSAHGGLHARPFEIAPGRRLFFVGGEVGGSPTYVLPPSFARASSGRPLFQRVGTTRSASRARRGGGRRSPRRQAQEARRSTSSRPRATPGSSRPPT